MLYGISLVAITAGYYGYWIAWLYKVYYFGWATAFLATVGLAVFHGREAKGLIWSLWPLAVWEGYIALSAFWAPDRDVSLYMLSIRILFPVAFVIGYIWMRNLPHWKLSSFFPAMAFMQLPVIVWTLITIGQLYNEELGAVRTGLAELTLVAIPFLTWRALERPSSLRYVSIGVAMLILAGSGSRTGVILGLAVMVGTIISLRPRNRMRTLSKALAGTIVLAAVGAAVPQVRGGAVDAVDRLRSQTEWSLSAWTDPSSYRTPEGEEPEDRERRLQMLVVVRSFLEQPMFGNGYYSTYFYTKELTGYGIGAHGLLSLFLGELGLLGAIIFIWLIAQWFGGVNRAVRLAKTFEAKGFWLAARWTMVAMLLFGLFHQVDQTPSFYVLLSWGFAAKHS